MRPIVPRHVAEASQAQVSLVRESGRLEGMTGPLGPEMLRGDGAQLGIDHRQKTLQRTVVPLFPGAQHLGDGEIGSPVGKPRIRFLVDRGILHLAIIQAWDVPDDHASECVTLSATLRGAQL